MTLGLEIPESCEDVSRGYVNPTTTLRQIYARIGTIACPSDILERVERCRYSQLLRTHSSSCSIHDMAQSPEIGTLVRVLSQGAGGVMQRLLGVAFLLWALIQAFLETYS